MVVVGVDLDDFVGGVDMVGCIWNFVVWVVDVVVVVVY